MQEYKEKEDSKADNFKDEAQEQLKYRNCQRTFMLNVPPLGLPSPGLPAAIPARIVLVFVCMDCYRSCTEEDASGFRAGARQGDRSLVAVDGWWQACAHRWDVGYIFDKSKTRRRWMTR